MKLVKFNNDDNLYRLLYIEPTVKVLHDRPVPNDFNTRYHVGYLDKNDLLCVMLFATGSQFTIK